MKNLIKYCIALSLVCALFTSCSNFLEVEMPVANTTTTEVFSDFTMARNAVTGIYSTSMLRKFTNGNITIFPALSSDELYPGAVNTLEEEVFNNSINPGLTAATSTWTGAYNLIYHCNLVAEQLERSTAIHGNERDQLLGEVKFLRAMFYFYLLNYYGDVPLTTTSDYRFNASLPRELTSVVYAQITKDLMDARELLGVEYQAADRTRVNKWGATALLARVYLYTGNWAGAIAMSSDVIENGPFSLTDPSVTFSKTSPGTILQFAEPNSSTTNTQEGLKFIPSSSAAVPPYLITDSLLNGFEKEDKRALMWLGSNTVGGKTYYYPFKYKVRTGTAGTAKSELNIALRIAEQYLIRGEALAEERRFSEAVRDLDEIRSRAGLSLVVQQFPAIEKKELLEKIYQERRIEFFAEWGHRWFDLKRSGRADAVLKWKPYWRSEAALFPVPQSELLSNPKLYQNKGYN